ncbi:MAG: hypothetical protein R3B72_49905 [Polyangiaceae bacterium]
MCWRVPARALGLTCDHQVPEALQTETARRGFRGERRTDYWCCSVTAIAGALLDQAVLLPPEDLGGLRLALFAAFAGEAIWWDRLATTGAASPLAHFRYAVLATAHRVAVAIGPNPLPSIVSDPAWLEPARRGELLESIRRAGGATKSAFARDILYDATTMTRWTRGGGTPRPEALRAFASWGEEHARLDKAQTHRALRWHYGLATLTDRASTLLGRPAVTQACELALAMMRCTHQATASRPAEEQGRRSFVLFHSFHDLTDLEASLIDHARAHGADEAFVDDLRRAHAAMREPGALEPPASTTLRLLEKYLPRRAPPADEAPH